MLLLYGGMLCNLFDDPPYSQRPLQRCLAIFLQGFVLSLPRAEAALLQKVFSPCQCRNRTDTAAVAKRLPG